VAEGLGIKADFKGLKVDPCIPKSWPGFTDNCNTAASNIKSRSRMRTACAKA